MEKSLFKLDNLVKEGKIIEAFETYFSDNVTTYDESGNTTTSKEEKLELLKGFFNEFTTIEEISLKDSFINGDTSYSNFTFVFKKGNGEGFEWNEVIIRKWKDNLVVSEFYSNQDYNKLKETLVKPVAKVSKEKASSPKTKAVKKETAPKAKEVAKEAPAAKKVSKASTTKKAAKKA